MNPMTRSLVRPAILATIVSLVALVCGCGGSGVLDGARRKLGTGDPAGALAILDQEARQNPRDGRTLRLLAEAAAAMGEDERAADALVRAESLGRRDSLETGQLRVRLWRVRFAPVRKALDALDEATAEELTAARGALDGAELLAPHRAENPAARARLLLLDGPSDEVETLLATAADQVHGDPEAARAVVSSLLRVASSYAALGRPATAVEMGRRAAELAPSDVRVEYDLGVHLHELGEATSDTAAFGEAARRFGRVLELLPGDVDARYNLGLSLYRLGRVREAEAEVRALLARAPLESRGHLLGARLALAAGDSLRARAHAVASRAVRGETSAVPASALSVSADAGHAGRKVFVLTGPPDRIFRYRERSGDVVEVWFRLDPPGFTAFSAGRVIAELELSEGKGDRGSIGLAGTDP